MSQTDRGGGENTPIPKLDEYPEIVKPQGWGALPRDRKADTIQFRLTRTEMLGILADVYGFERPDPERDRLFNDEITAIILETQALERWDRMHGRGAEDE